MIGGVLRIRVDFAARIQHEAGLGREIDHQLFGEITRLLHFFRVGPRLGAVLDHAQHAAGLQRRVEADEIRIRGAAADPVVDVAEREHGIDAARCDERRLLGIECGESDAIELRRRFRQPRLQIVHRLLQVFAAAAFSDRHRVGQRRSVTAVVAQVRREDLGVPGAAAGRDLEYGLVRSHAEETQRFARMPERVARGVLRIAPAAGDGIGQRGIGDGRLTRFRGRARICIHGGAGADQRRAQGEDQTATQCGRGQIRHGGVRCRRKGSTA